MVTHYWCFKCERVFRNDGNYYGKEVLPGRRGGYWCPFCGASPMDTLDWHTFIFGVGAPNNYPDQPIDGFLYHLYPIS